MSARRLFSATNILLVGCNELALELASALASRKPASLTFCDADAPESAMEFGQRFMQHHRAASVPTTAHALPPTEEFLLNFEVCHWHAC
jgi:hypothetical protein